MPVEDVFSITGRGTVATGRIERGIVKVGEEVELIGFNCRQEDGRDGRGDVPQAAGRGARPATTSVCCCAASTRRTSSAAWCWRRRARSSRTRSSMREVYVLTKEEGGRHTPFFKGYRPQFYFRTTDVTGTIELPDGMEMVMPGDNIADDDRADHADRDGRGAALRHPRRWPHGRRRRRRPRSSRDNAAWAAMLRCARCVPFREIQWLAGSAFA